MESWAPPYRPGGRNWGQSCTDPAKSPLPPSPWPRDQKGHQPPLLLSLSLPAATPEEESIEKTTEPRVGLAFEDGGCRLKGRGVPGGHQLPPAHRKPVHHPDGLFSSLPGVCGQQAQSTVRTPGGKVAGRWIPSVLGPGWMEHAVPIGLSPAQCRAPRGAAGGSAGRAEVNAAAETDIRCQTGSHLANRLILTSASQTKTLLKEKE